MLKFNPDWTRVMYIKRKNLSYLRRVLEKEPAVILIGSRQVGKTTLMKKMEQDIKEEGGTVFYFNLELPSSLNIFSSGVEGFLEYMRAQGIRIDDNPSAENIYIFIDEFQYINGAGRFLKALIDNFPCVKIAASGSSSVEIQKSLKESLVGRKRIAKIYPLDFSEFLYFNNVQEAEFFESIEIHKPLQPALSAVFGKLFGQFVVWGGMPKVILENDLQQRRELLEEICSSYLQKDIKGLVQADNLGAFNKLMILLAQESSSIISIHSLANILKVPRAELDQQIFILENTFVNFLINPFFRNKRKELSKAQKSVFYDNGIRNYLIKDMSELDMRIDKGGLVESAVYNELKKNVRAGMEIYYWRTQHQTEIDFILKYDDALIPVEVKSGTIKYVPPALVSFAKQYNSPFVVVVNKGYWKEMVMNGVKVFFVPLFLASFIPSLVLGE